MAVLLLDILHIILSAIPFGLPEQLTNSFIFFGNYLSYANGFVDIPGTLAALVFFIKFLEAFFTFKAVMWLYNKLRPGSAGANEHMPLQVKSKK